MAVARDVMTTNPRIVDTGTTVMEVARILADEDIGSVIVCGDTLTLAGMITDRDLAVGVVAKGLDSSSTRVGDLLDSDRVITVDADDTVERVAQTMSDAAVRRVPVLDADRRVVGIISQADMATATQVPGETVGDMVAGISEAPGNTNPN